ncbi:hypothetical protein [Pseudomonas sp. DSP3-2-2]|uniref:hypothetical protein n=1 Tax=unclassified Pseudomonas TaxID=196821 RepID=UPI003CEA5F76
MRRVSAYSLVVFSSVIVGSGCTSYASKPIISDRVESGKKEMISSFTYEVDAPWKDSRFGKSAYEVTQKMIPTAKDNSSRSIASTLPELEIKISEFSSGGACTQEYLTGLSLGLIPSWCTRPELFKFNFTLINKQGFCRQKTYSIGSMTFSHITVIPFAMFNTDNQPLTIYQAALKDFLQEGQCAAP